MPLISPTSQPPPVDISNGSSSNKATVSPRQVLEQQSHDTKTTSAFRCEEESSAIIGKIPLLKLDVASISDTLAARLAISLLGHVLFLKNQIPFPIMQLSRIPTNKSNPRATKRRNELISSFDTLASHLNTTFTALSTAFARSKPQLASSTLHSTKDAVRVSSRAYLAILVGPTMSSAKSKVIYAVDGLETRVWGETEDFFVSNEKGSDEEEGSSGEESEEQPEESDDEPDSCEDDTTDEDSDAASDESSTDEGSEEISPVPIRTYTTFAEEQRFLQSAERQLSRLLATTDSDGLGAEMSPTQVHVLIQAPRRFDHPAWIPRQNLTSSMTSALAEFLEESGLSNNVPSPVSRSRPGNRSKVEGVWITGRVSGLQAEPLLGRDPSNTPSDEGDELIWWSWDGKIVGFTDCLVDAQHKSGSETL